MKRAIWAICSLTLLVSACGAPQAELDKLKSENEILRRQFDELQNGEARLVAIIDNAYSQGQFESAKANIEILAAKHPESTSNKKYVLLLPQIDAGIAEASARKQAEAKEQARLANIGNTGMWVVAQYVDSFGDRTGESFIRNKELIRGVFSNTATEDSELNVVFLIDGPKEMSIQLYEYAGNNPVKSYSSDSYAVMVKDKDQKKHTFRATNSSDRLRLGPKDAEALHGIFLMGGSVQFWIQEVDTPTTQYQFKLDSADFYDNAYAKLTSK